MAALLTFVMGFGVLGAFVFVNALWSGYVLSMIWGWLIVPIFHAPPLSIIAAVSLALVVEFLTYHHSYSEKESKNYKDRISDMISYPLTFLVIGWVVKMFI